MHPEENSGQLFEEDLDAIYGILPEEEEPTKEEEECSGLA